VAKPESASACQTASPNFFPLPLPDEGLINTPIGLDGAALAGGMAVSIG